MSGNPFRRPQPTPEQDGGHVTSGSTSEQPPRKRKVKKVSFVSPIASPQEPPSHPRFPTLEELDQGPKSPPPNGLQDTNDGLDTGALLRGDPTAGGTVDLEANAISNRSGFASQPPPTSFNLAQPPPAKRGPPPNPFASAANSTAESNGKETGRISMMDVDAFKRLLLTGKKEADSPADVDVQSTQASAARDRPSITVDTRTDSKDFSTDSDTSSDGGTATDEEMNGVEEVKSLPAHDEHSLSNPQDSSFDDFDEASLQLAQDGSILDDPATASRTRAVESAPPPQPPTEAKKAAVKPPPPPSSRRHGQTSGSITRPRGSSDASIMTATSSTPTLDTDKQPRPPPPPPRVPASRSSAREITREALDNQSTNPITVGDTSRSSSAGSAMPPQPPTAGAKPKPPPPPSRQAHRPSSRDQPQPQPHLTRSTSSGSVTPQVPPHRRAPALAPSNATNSASSAPPPPPPRRGDKATSSESNIVSGSRRSSVHSTASSVHSAGAGAGTEARRGSVSSTSSHRRGGSLRGADQPATTTAEEVDGQSTSIVSDVPPEAHPQESSAAAVPRIDFLADLDAFQREVDALRSRALGGE